MLVRMWSNRNSHSLLIGMQKGTATLEDRLAVSYKTKHTLTIQSSNQAPWCLPKEENLCPKTCTWMFIAALFIIAKLGSKQDVLHRGMDKLWYTQTVQYYSALKRSELSSHEKACRHLKCIITKWKKPVWEGYLLCDSNYMTFWKRNVKKLWRQ